MIFVTVGTWKFDQLIQKIDELVKRGLIKEEVVCQIANGEYVPQWIRKYFKLKPDIEEYIKKASLVISHGGVGSVFSVLKHQRPLIAVSNPNVADRHQDELLCELAKEKYLIWCKEVEMLEDIFLNLKVNIKELRLYLYENDDLITDIVKFIEK